MKNTPLVSLSRQEIVRTAGIWVVKVGTNVLTRGDGRLNAKRIGQLVDELVAIRAEGRRVILVSSGAVGAGLGILGLGERPTARPKLQAIAAIGQSKLMETYEKALARHGQFPAQVLLTADDLLRRKKYLNVRNTFLSLLEYGVLPVVNENDTVSIEELDSTFGDNDRLAALIASLFTEPLVVLLTDVEGLYDGDPAKSSSRLIPVVDRWTPELMTMVAEKRSSRSKGGMSSKLSAAQMVTTSGGSVVIANGDDPHILKKIYRGDEVGTVFFPKGRLHARKRWLRFATIPKGRLTVDSGAAIALTKKGKSLLPIGVTAVLGRFDRGDIVAVQTADGVELARGLTNYSSHDMTKIVRHNSREIAKRLGECPYEEAIHRDNMQLIEP